MGLVDVVKVDWVGIGAQRSGTTWFANALCQHPEMAFSSKKELHYFDRFLHEPFADEDAERYPAKEFTPGYLRWPWVPDLLKRSRPDALLIVILRDPVERFFSALRWHERLGQRPQQVLNFAAADATWGGMYARQLRMWSAVFPCEQIHVEQYERAVENPQAAVERVWAKLGLDSVPLVDVSETSGTSTPARNPWRELHPRLRAIYRPELRALIKWGIEPQRWLNLWP